MTKRALFLLAYAQRFARVFGLFEKRTQTPSVKFDELLERLWAVAAGKSAAHDELHEELSAAIPGEDWVVDGFHDALAQYVGGLAVGALEGLSDAQRIDGSPELGVFDLLRLLLSEMRLGRSEPGEDASGRQFDSGLHREPLITKEAEFWRDLVVLLSTRTASVDELRDWAMLNTFDPGILEPVLTEGLARDGIGSR